MMQVVRVLGKKAWVIKKKGQINNVTMLMQNNKWQSQQTNKKLNHCKQLMICMKQEDFFIHHAQSRYHLKQLNLFCKFKRNLDDLTCTCKTGTGLKTNTRNKDFYHERRILHFKRFSGETSPMIYTATLLWTRNLRPRKLY